REFVMADIPGLIEGAHEGIGIGDRFLGHVERCRVLLHLIDVTQDDFLDSYRVIRGELEAYDEVLGQKDEIVALTKTDSLLDEEIEEKVQEFEATYGLRPFAISAVARTNMDDILRAIMSKIESENKREEEAEIEPTPWRP
ncbi:MAG: 50S ribosome-binding GTPase, partial [Cohaesibacter sp.]|nr:50S ribosome-binding GTPase [Cohaesibacter sp.]